MSVSRGTSILAILGFALTVGVMTPSPAHAAKPTKGKTKPAASTQPAAPPPDEAPAAPAPSTAGLNTAAMTPERKAACEQLCDTKDNASCPRARPMADCVKTCTQAAATVPPKCLKHWDEWVKTDAKIPWTCGPNGYPKTAHYDQLSDFYSCIEMTAGDASKSPKPKAPDCAVSANERFCDTCQMTSCGEELLACGRNKECQAINKCLQTCPPSGKDEQKATCVNKCKSKHEGGRAAYEEMKTCSQSCAMQCEHGGYQSFGYHDENDEYQVSVSFSECMGVFP